MKQKLLLMTIVCVFGLNAIAQTTIYLPTTAYRTEDSKEIKFSYRYDTNGHVISELRYIKRNGNYILVDSIALEYHKLPNGKFATIKDEAKRRNVMPELLGFNEETYEPIYSNEYRYDILSHRKTTAAYDSKGMQLWTQGEYKEGNEWSTSREEAVLDGNGIRTGIRQYYDGEIVDADIYTFDAKGRIIGQLHKHESLDSKTNSNMTYTWGEDDMIVSCSETIRIEEDSYVSLDEYLYYNITTVLNKEYFEPYSLNPIALDDYYGGETDIIYPLGRPRPLSFTEMQRYAWNDYTLRQWFFNLDASGKTKGNPLTGTRRTVVDNAKGEITVIMSADGFERKEVYEKSPYGGYKYTAIENGINKGVIIKEYNQYGALIKDYRYDYDEYDYGNGYIYTNESTRNKQYDRQYDAQERPVKTIYSHKSKRDDGDEIIVSQFEETYDAWTAVTVVIPTSVEAIKSDITSTVSVYPNPVTDILYIKAENPQSKLYDQQGKLLLQTNKTEIDFSAYPKGIYILDVNDERTRIIK